MTSIRTRLAAAMLSGLWALSAGTFAQSTATISEMAEGEIRKVDKDTKKLTIKHGEIKNLDMPGMTMLFQVKDLGLLDKVKAGDKVKFRAEKSDSGFVVLPCGAMSTPRSAAKRCIQAMLCASASRLSTASGSGKSPFNTFQPVAARSAGNIGGAPWG